MSDIARVSKFFHKISCATDIAQVIEAMYRSCLLIGGDKLSYHSDLLSDSKESTKSNILAVGFPDEWVKLYKSMGRDFIDPVHEVVLQADRVMTWREAIGKLKLTDGDRAYLKQAEQNGLLAGLGFPLWGPKGQNAFVAIGFPGDDVPLSAEINQTERLLLQAAHAKIVELSAVHPAPPILSDREREVLTWIAQGKSNTDIATILAISPETVSTYTRRIYAKLNCHDRIGAVVKALKMRLIRL